MITSAPLPSVLSRTETVRIEGGRVDRFQGGQECPRGFQPGLGDVGEDHLPCTLHEGKLGMDAPDEARTENKNCVPRPDLQALLPVRGGVRQALPAQPAAWRSTHPLSGRCPWPGRRDLHVLGKGAVESRSRSCADCRPHVRPARASTAGIPRSPQQARRPARSPAVRPVTEEPTCSMTPQASCPITRGGRGCSSRCRGDTCAGQSRRWLHPESASARCRDGRPVVPGRQGAAPGPPCR